jgi:cephalosporin hydroxylase
MRKRLAVGLNNLLYRPDGSAAEDYHLWYYNTNVWRTISWMGVEIYKSPMDMWNYQEILFALQPSVIIEFGTHRGGSALYFATVMRQIGNPFALLSVDIDHSLVHPVVRADRHIELLQSSSVAAPVAAKIAEMKQQHPGKIFAILDSDHTKQHVLAEMLLLRPLLSPGDYMIVEDSNINGHPVLPLWGAGPYEAIEEYFALYPEDYTKDSRSRKFGFTFAPEGFLVRAH